MAHKLLITFAVYCSRTKRHRIIEKKGPRNSMFGNPAEKGTTVFISNLIWIVKNGSFCHSKGKCPYTLQTLLFLLLDIANIVWSRP